MRKIAVYTGNRSEFGLQEPLLKKLKESKEFELVLLVASSHLDPDFGSTVSEIEESGFDVSHKLKFNHTADYIYENPKTISEGINLISDALIKINPDILIVHGDRYEAFSAVIASTQMGILTLHIEGGDVTEGGTFDDSVRHAMTKLSHIHLTTNTEATKRIKQLGENPDNIFEVGSLSIDLIENKNFTNSKDVIKKYNLENVENIIVFTQHPVPINIENLVTEFAKIEEALEEFCDETFKVICTFPNSDIGGKKIIEIIKSWKEKHKFIDVYESLGRKDFHGLLDLNNTSNYKVCFLGNSSAGIKETPSLYSPSVIIGNRQKGRLSSSNILNSEPTKNSIISNLDTAFNNKEFILNVKNCKNPYGSGNMVENTMSVLRNLNFDNDALTKKFFDLKESD